MIIVRLAGGLGNQLFQYAAGRRLALRHDAELKLDISGLSGSERKYALDRYNILEVFATPQECLSLTTPNYSRLSRAIHGLLHKKPKRAKSHIKVKEPHFQPRYLDLPDNILLEGYWQSEQYFPGISDLLRKEFTLKEPPSGTNKDVSEAISDCNAVSLHVRRGDYVSNPKFNQAHGTVSLDYYRRCVKLMTEKCDDVHFFVFSDDPQWCQENLEFDSPATYVSHNPPETPQEDMWLMSLCQHNIIANSTFSWWGAWLNPNPDKVVYAPKKWYATNKRRTDGLIPGAWLRV